MNYIAHRSGAILVTVGTLQVLNIMNVEIKSLEIAVLTGACIMGAYFPDVDHPDSHISNKMSIFIMLTKVLVLLPLLVVHILNAINNFLFFRKVKSDIFALEHREITHAPLIWLAFFIPIKIWCGNDIFCNYLFGGFFLGVFSHLVLDLIAGGLPLLYPFKLDRIKLPCNIRTGSMEERRIYGIMNLISLINVIILLSTGSKMLYF